MKITNRKISLACFVGLSAMVFLSACDPQEIENIRKVSDDDVAEAESESLTDSYFEDSDGIVNSALGNNEGASGGRVAEGDERLHCAVITFSEASNDTAGTITIDFSDNESGFCEDPRGNVRKGKIYIEYLNGPAGKVGFTTITTFGDYHINDVRLEGTRTVERVPASSALGIRHEITLENGQATWPDNTFATREVDFTGEWVLGEEKYLVDGSAEGKNRRGKDYTMNITETLEYRVQCSLAGIHMAAAGAKLYTTAEGNQINIDFGDGECDRIVTVSVGGLTSDITVGKN